MPPESLMQAWARMYRPNSPNHLCHKFTLPLLQIYRRKEPCPAVPVSFFTGCIQMSLQTGLGLQLSKTSQQYTVSMAGKSLSRRNSHSLCLLFVTKHWLPSE